MSALTAELTTAWNKRSKDFETSNAVRVFHGPGEGKGTSERFAIEVFGRYAWVYEWEAQATHAPGPQQASEPRSETEKIRISDFEKKEITEFLKSKSIEGAVFLARPEKDLPAETVLLFGSVPEVFESTERGLKYKIRFLGVRHPGLFLDHAPLRAWLMKSMKGKTVLNTFAYTGSLSLASYAGGAKHVTTLDLSRPTTEWAKENWKLNVFPEEAGDFIFGDVFEWLPKFKKRSRLFDTVILDPPSFSRGVKGNFSTSKDLPRLHSLAIECLNSGGLLITSINSRNVPKEKFLREIESAANALSRKTRILQELSAPATSFPRWESLKGWIFEVT